MHVLFLTPQLPFPPEQGTALRNFNLLRLAARLSQVSLLSYAPAGSTVPVELEELCETVRLVAPPPKRDTIRRLRTLLLSSRADMADRVYSDAFNQALREMMQSRVYDFLQVEGIELARFVLDLPIEDRPPFLFDAHNAEWLLQRRAAQADWQQLKRWPAAVYSTIQWRRLRHMERQTCLEAQLVLACSELDAVALQALDPRIHAHVLPNGVDTTRCCPNLQPAEIEHPALVFTGKMDYRPNVDAVTWFAHDVWPLVLAGEPRAHLYIVGKDPAPSVAALNGNRGIHVTGYVPSVQPYLAAADCYIAPLRVGGGTRLKLLEAMACGLPIVSTTLGAEGLEVYSSKHLLLAHSADAFADAVLSVLRDREFAASLAANARELACSRYEWDLLLPVLDEAYQEMGNSSRGSSSSDRITTASS